METSKPVDNYGRRNQVNFIKRSGRIKGHLSVIILGSIMLCKLT